MGAVDEYRTAVTAKQASIEKFKYRSADLKELLGYLPGAGTGISRAAADAGEERLAQKVDEVLRLALLYDLTSDEKYAPMTREQVEALLRENDRAKEASVRRRVRTLVISIRRLLEVKPAVDRLLTEVFEQPVALHEERVAALYYRNYAVAASRVDHYRVGLYGVCIALVGVVVLGIHRLQRSAKALALANEQLEERVANRTQELAQRNRDMRIVLDNVDQALLAVNLEGRLSRERSAALDRWFPGAASADLLWDVLKIVDRDCARWLDLGWRQLREGGLPYDIVLDQLPHALKLRERHYEIAYSPILDGKDLEKVLLVISDVTERVERSRFEREQREQALTFQHALRDRSGFLEFLSECGRLIESASGGGDFATTLRAVHTLKGNLGMYGMEGMAGVCHELESKLVETRQPLTPEDVTLLLQAWSALADMARRFTSTEQGGIEVFPEELRTLRLAVGNAVPPAELLRRLRSLERQPVRRRFERLSEQAKYLARRVGKSTVEVLIEPNDVRLDSKRWAAFWSNFVHLVRNAVDHGIESERERALARKSGGGQIVLRAKEVNDCVVIEMSDDGRGIDWGAVRERAEKLGLAVRSEQESLGPPAEGRLVHAASGVRILGPRRGGGRVLPGLSRPGR